MGIPNGAWTSAREQNNDSLKSALPSTRELDSQGQIAPGRHLEHCWGRISGGKQLVHSQLGAQMAQDSDQRGPEGWNGLPRGSQDGCVGFQPANNLASRTQLRACIHYICNIKELGIHLLHALRPEASADLNGLNIYPCFTKCLEQIPNRLQLDCESIPNVLWFDATNLFAKI